ncbi:MAG: OsmC family protein [Bryobacterales bacterium]|nr:OsmC family protein [Bryobacterales bacterium]
METTVTYLGGVKFEADCRGHKIVSDQPIDAKGSDEGMTPPELMLASLGTCAAFYAAYYLNFNHLSTGGLRVKVSAEKAKGPVRMDDFVIHVDVPGVDESHLDALRKSVEKCLIHATLTHPPSIRTEIAVGESVGVG